MRTRFDLKNDISLHSRAEIAAVQDRLLAQQIRYCRTHSPFYRKKFAGFPDRDYDFELLRELPTTAKSDIARHNDEFLAVPMREIADIYPSRGECDCLMSCVNPIWM